MKRLYTLAIAEHSNSKFVFRKDQPFAHCIKMMEDGGFFGVQIIDQKDDSIFAEGGYGSQV